LSNIVDFKLSDYHCGITLTSGWFRGGRAGSAPHLWATD